MTHSSTKNVTTSDTKAQSALQMNSNARKVSHLDHFMTSKGASDIQSLSRERYGDSLGHKYQNNEIEILSFNSKQMNPAIKVSSLLTKNQQRTLLQNIRITTTDLTSDQSKITMRTPIKPKSKKTLFTATQQQIRNHLSQKRIKADDPHNN